MKKYILFAFFTSLTFSQSETDEEPSDSTFIIINSGDSIRINKFEADLRFQPMLELDLEFSDFDSTKYDLTEVNKLVDSDGNISMNRKSIFMINPDRLISTFSIPLILIYFIFFPIVKVVIFIIKFLIEDVLKQPYSDEKPVFKITDLNEYIKKVVVSDEEIQTKNVSEFFNNALNLKAV